MFRGSVEDYIFVWMISPQCSCELVEAEVVNLALPQSYPINRTPARNIFTLGTPFM